MPYFSKKIDWNRSLDVRGAVKVTTNQHDFKKYIKKIVTSKKYLADFYKNKKIMRSRKRIIQKYFFNSDGKADIRMLNFLEKNI